MQLTRILRLVLAAAAVPVVAFTAVTYLSARADVDAAVADLGSVPRGETVSHEFTLTNQGNRELRITKVDTTCATTTSIEPGAAVSPGSAIKVLMAIDTAGLSEGETTKKLLIQTNDPLNHSVYLAVKFTVWSEFALSARSLKFTPERTRQEFAVEAKSPTGARVLRAVATDPRVSVELIAAEGARGIRVVARTNADAASRWDLGNVILATSSRVYPEIRVPVRGSLASSR